MSIAKARARQGLLALFLFASPPVLAQLPAVEDVHRELLEILHGEPRSDVRPSSALCWQLAHPGPDAKPPDDRAMSPGKWYLGEVGDCHVTYPREIRQLFTPMADKSTLTQFIFDPGKSQRLINLLEQLSALDATRRFSVQQKFDLQLGLWELIVALQDRRHFVVSWDPPLDQKLIDRILTAALGLLPATLLTRAETDALPDTLAQLPELVDVPAIGTAVSQLSHRNKRWLEVVSPGQAHHAFAVGRVYGRIFLTSDDPEQLRLLHDYLKGKKTLALQGVDWADDRPGDAKANGFEVAQPDLVDLPTRIGSMHAILVLYFQALDQDFQPVPTHLVAGWREVWFTGKVESGSNMAQADPQFHVRIIDYRKNLDARPGRQVFNPIYEQVPESKISKGIFLDVNPVYPKDSVTTLRAACLSCHANRIKTFDYRGPQGFIGFSPPKPEADARLTNTPLEQRLSKRFKEWSQQFARPAQGEPGTGKPNP